MKYKLLLTLFAVFTCIFSTQGQLAKTVNVPQAGSLAALLGTNKTTVTDLTLTGTINDADFETIKQMSALKRLDMGGALIQNQTLPSQAFYNKSYDEVILPSNLKVMNSHAFWNARITKELKLPASLEIIREGAFMTGAFHSINFSNCKNLTNISYYLFSGSTFVNTTIDLSACSSLTNFTVHTGYAQGPFTHYEGKVILPSNMTVLPDYAFAQFRGTVELPQGLKTLGNASFTRATLAQPLVLPSSLEVINISSFLTANLHSIDFSKCVNLRDIQYYCFNGAIIQNGKIDLSNCSNLKGFTVHAGYAQGPFINYAGKVILPANMTTLPPYTFAQFKGTVEFPVNLEVIGDFAFVRSVMTEKMRLPSSLKTVGRSAFDSSTLQSLDFSMCSNLEKIGPAAFLALKMTENKLDFSNCNKLAQFGLYNTSHGAFTSYSGHVIMPKNIKVIPTRTFQGFTGSVDLPEGLLQIDYQGFLQANLSQELVFPNSLEVIDDFAFGGASVAKGIKFSTRLKRVGRRSFEAVKTPYMDFSTSKNLEEIGAGAFMNVSLSEKNVLDFSNSSKLSRFILYGGDANKYGAFTAFNGHVILSNALTEIPSFAFYKFGGILTLPENLKYIRAEAFTAATMTEITLPRNLFYIHHWAFLNCSNLQKITIKNPQPPFLEESVFQGINAKTCKLEVPQGSLELYATSEQWKDFLDYVPTTPNKIDKINLFYTDNGGKEFQATYEGVRIGEYYWMNNNLNHYTKPDAFPFANAVLPVATKKDIDLGHERMAMFDYFKPAVTAPNRNDPTYWSYLLTNLKTAGRTSSEGEALTEFNKYYGNYYWNPFVRANFSKVFQMAEGTKQNLKAKGVWDLPSVSDIRELIGMCGNGTHPELIHYLSFSYDPQNKNLPAFVNIWTPEEVDNKGKKQGGYYWWFKANSSYYSNYNNPYQGPPAYGFNSTDFYSAANGNKYGFNLVPTGYRFDKWDQNTPITIWHYGDDNLKSCVFTPANGDFSALNQEAWITLKDNADFHIYDAVEIRYPDGGIRRQPVRYCRPLTDAELGYKLYINAKLVSKTTKLDDIDYVFTGEEILLRDIFLKNTVNSSDIKIIKLNLNQAPPTGYYELERGYIRGLYVQYYLNNLNPRHTISDLLEIAWKNKNIWLSRVTNYTPPVETRSALSFEVPIEEESAVVSVYPNPVEDILYTTKEVDYIEIFDMNGKSMIKSGQKGNAFNVGDLKSGIYMIKILMNGKVTSMKMIKQ